MKRSINLSIIIPVHNERRYLDELLDQIYNLDYPEKYEILILDNASRDGSYELALKYASKNPRISILRFEKNRPVGEILAFGVEKAKGRYIAKIDSDCMPPKGWLKTVEYLKGDVGVVSFPVIPPPDIEYLARKFGYQGKGLPPPGVKLHGTCVIMKKSVILDVGNYPHRSVGEDTKLFKKIMESGWKIRVVEDIAVRHKEKQKNLYDFLKRYHRSGLYSGDEYKTRILFCLVLPLLIALLILSWLFHPVSIFPLSLILLLGFLGNPLAVKRYVKEIQRPRNIIVKAILFTIIKILVSMSFTLGVWMGSVKPLFRG